MNNVKGYKGYKVFNNDWTCKGFQYEVGKTFKHNGDIGVCKEGFHFCKKASNCFNYYSFDSNNKVAEVLATGNVKTEGDKSVTDEIIIVREITWNELLTIVNEGNNNTGRCNIGDWNSGDFNTGDRNTGDFNTGDRNTGDWNSGDRNTGNRNTGDWNSGNRNTGDWNSGNYNIGNGNSGNYNVGNWNSGDYNVGNWNSGDFNITNYSNGVFNTKQNTINFFDKPSNWTLKDWFNSDIRNILNWNFELTKWINEKNMTDKEKEQYKEHKTTGGYLKKFEFKEACQNMWDNLTDNEKNKVVTELPNFDKDKFKEITGIEVEEKFYK